MSSNQTPAEEYSFAPINEDTEWDYLNHPSERETPEMDDGVDEEEHFHEEY